MNDTPHSIAVWCTEQDNKVKNLQNICLDKFEQHKSEITDLLVRLSEIETELKNLHKDCISMF